MKLDLTKYHEDHPHRMKRIVWAFVNKFFFPLFSFHYRLTLLRLFGAKIEETCVVHGSVKIFAPWNLVAAKFICLGPNVEIYNKDKLVIGNQVIISRDTFICTASHDVSSPVFSLVTRPIRIQNDVWIAAKVMILPGVVIGEGSVVGAGAVVAKDVPPWSIAVGNPAHVVGSRKIAE